MSSVETLYEPILAYHLLGIWEQIEWKFESKYIALMPKQKFKMSSTNQGFCLSDKVLNNWYSLKNFCMGCIGYIIMNCTAWFKWCVTDLFTFKLVLVIYCWDKIVVRWMSDDVPTDDKSILGQMMAWYCHATSHYLNQWWPRYVSHYNITMVMWVLYITMPYHQLNTDAK